MNFEWFLSACWILLINNRKSRMILYLHNNTTESCLLYLFEYNIFENSFYKISTTGNARKVAITDNVPKYYIAHC